MTNRLTARKVIATIRESSRFPMTYQQFIDVLEDGEALANLGFEDEDQEAIEQAHALTMSYIEADTAKANKKLDTTIYHLVHKRSGEIRQATLRELCKELGISTVRSAYDAEYLTADAWIDSLDDEILNEIWNYDWVDFRDEAEAREYANEVISDRADAIMVEKDKEAK